MKKLTATSIILLCICSLALVSDKAVAQDKSDIDVLDIKVEPIRRGRNIANIEVHNDSNEDRALDLDIRTESSEGNWQTQFPHVIKGGQTQLIRHAFKINGPIAEGLRIRLRFYAAGQAAGTNEQSTKQCFKEVEYYVGDLERAEPDNCESLPASDSQRRIVIEVRGQFQKCLANTDYQAVWHLFSQDFKDAEFHGRLSTLEAAMKTPYAWLPLSREELLALEPKSAGMKNGILALTAALQDERWRVDFVKVADRWLIDSLERIDAAPKEKIPLDPAAQEQALRDAFELWQYSIRDGECEIAWGLFASSLRRSRQYENDFQRFAELAGSDDNPMRKICLDLRPHSVTEMRVGESAVLNAGFAGQPWKIRFVMEDGRWKIGQIWPDRSSGGDWQTRLLPKMRKRITEHFDIFCHKGSTAEKEIDKIADERDRGFGEICRFLGKASDVRIRMVLFEDAATKYAQTGHQGAGWAVGNMIVEIYNDEQKLDPYHETTHILMRPYGLPPALFNEGFATYMSQRLGSHALKSMEGGEATLYERVRELNGEGRLIPLEELLTYTEIGSRRSNPPVAYPQAASFVKFLIDTYGKDKFLKAYGTLRNSSDDSVQKQNVDALERIYGKSLGGLGDEWKKAFLKP